MIIKFDEWLLESRLLEKLNFAPGFFDPESIRILTKIWESYSELKKLGLISSEPPEEWSVRLNRTDSLHLENIQAMIGVVEFPELNSWMRNKEITVVVGTLENSSNAAEFFGNRITLNSNYEKKKTTTIIFHELMHAIDPDLHLIVGGGGTLKFPLLRKLLLVKRPLSMGDWTSRDKSDKKSLEVAEYFYKNTEFRAYIGELYLAAFQLSLEPSRSAKAKELLRAGKTSEIFQMLPEDYVERKIHQLYFGGNDEAAIKYLKPILPERFFELTKAENALEKGLISLLPGGDKIRKKFLSSLYSIISGEVKKIKIEVSIPEMLYNLLDVANLLSKYPNLKKIVVDREEFVSAVKANHGHSWSSSRAGIANNAYFSIFSTAKERLFLLSDFYEKDRAFKDDKDDIFTEKIIKEMPKYSWTSSEVLNWLKKHEKDLRISKIYDEFHRNFPEDFQTPEKFFGLPLSQQQLKLADLIAKSYKKDIDAVKKLFG